MTFPVRIESGLIAASADITALALAEKSRLLVVSDTHGHYDAFESIVLAHGPSADALLFAGDGMWDVIQYLENATLSPQILAALPPVLAFVAGNGDGEQFRIALPAAPKIVQGAPGPVVITVPHRQVIEASGHHILLVHGHRYSVDVSLEILAGNARATGADIAIYGHTHIAYSGIAGKILVVNPGSPARPRGGTQPSFAVIELEAGTRSPVVEFYSVEHL